MLFLYCLLTYTLLSPELLNKCKLFNIKDSDCINSSFIPSSEYNRYLKSFNMPIIRDDYCTKNKCMAVVNNENMVQQQTPSPQTTPAQSTTSQVNTMTLTSTTTSTVIISVPPASIKTQDISESVKDDKSQNKCKKSEESADEQQEKTKKDCEHQSKVKKGDVGGEKEGKSAHHDIENKPKGKKNGENEQNNKKQDNEEKDITTVIREIPTTVTVEVPLTLFREHTTTAISKVPIINYSLTTFTEKDTTTETFFKTATVTSEIFKTTTLTTEILKTTTVSVINQQTTDYDHKENELDDENNSKIPTYDVDYKFPGQFKDIEDKFARFRSKKILKKDIDNLLMNLCDTKSKNFDCIPPFLEDKKKREFTCTDNQKSTDNDCKSESIKTVYISDTKSQDAVFENEKISTVYITKEPSVEKLTTVFITREPEKENISTVLETTPPFNEKTTTIFVAPPSPATDSHVEQEKTKTVFITQSLEAKNQDILDKVSTALVTTLINANTPATQEAYSTVFITTSVLIPTPQVVNQAPALDILQTADIKKKEDKTPLKSKEDCDEDIIPLLKDLIQTTLASAKQKHAKPKKSNRKIFKTFYAKRKKRKCNPKRECADKKGQPMEYEKICNEDHNV